MVSPLEFFKCVADDTRLRCLLLLSEEPELPVHEITAALDQSQPKVSRHLAHLRGSGLIQDRRQGNFVYYRLHPKLPGWVNAVLQQTAEADRGFVDENLLRLQRAAPGRGRTCRWSCKERLTLGSLAVTYSPGSLPCSLR